MKVLGVEIVDVVEKNILNSENTYNSCNKKIAETDKKYPRRAGNQKSPL